MIGELYSLVVSVNGGSVRDLDYLDDKVIVLDLIEYSIVTYTYSVVIHAREPGAIKGSWIF